MLHRYVGLASLLFIGFAALTGCILCFDEPLDAALNADLFHAAAGPIDPLTAASAVEQAHPDWRVLRLPLRLKPWQSLELQVERRGAGPRLAFDQVFVDRPDGHVAGMRKSGAGWDRRHFVQAIFAAHYTLLAGTWGRWWMGLCAVAWLVGNLIGVYLTWPRRAPVLRNWMRQWRVRPGVALPRLLLDLHRASGLWVLIGITALAFTSVSLNLYDEAFLPTVRALSPPRPSPFDAPPRPPPGAPIGFARALSSGVAAARAHGLDWPAAAIAYDPAHSLYGVTFTRSGFVSYRGLGPIAEYVDAANGRPVFTDNPYRDSAGEKLSRSLYPIHSGQVAGGFGVAITLVLGAATVEMCVTGAYLWLKRRRPRTPQTVA